MFSTIQPESIVRAAAHCFARTTGTGAGQLVCGGVSGLWEVWRGRCPPGGFREEGGRESGRGEGEGTWGEVGGGEIRFSVF